MDILSKPLQNPFSIDILTSNQQRFRPNALSEIRKKMIDIKSEEEDLDILMEDVEYALADYFSDNFDEEWVPNALDIAIGLDYVYQPIREFWSTFSSQMIAGALEEAFPDWVKQIDAPGQVGRRNFMQEMSLLVTHRALDERNAEELLALPSERRPSNATDVLEWLRSRAKKRLSRIRDERHRGYATLEMRFLEFDGAGRAEGALALMRQLELARIHQSAASVAT